nr:hypothetical protein BaRGS_026632 [Batillaria attramentaria]
MIPRADMLQGVRGAHALFVHPPDRVDAEVLDAAAMRAVHNGVWGTRWDDALWMTGLELGRKYPGHCGTWSDRPVGAEFVSFQQLLAESDVVIATCSVHANNQKLFNADTFSRMKNTAIFINVTRGALVDQEALLTALASGLSVRSRSVSVCHRAGVSVRGRAGRETRRRTRVIGIPATRRPAPPDRPSQAEQVNSTTQTVLSSKTMADGQLQTADMVDSAPDSRWKCGQATLVKVSWSDTDNYNHTNFASYPRFALDAIHDALSQGLLPESLSEKDIAAGVAEVKISYIGEAVEGDMLQNVQ